MAVTAYHVNRIETLEKQQVQELINKNSHLTEDFAKNILSHRKINSTFTSRLNEVL